MNLPRRRRLAQAGNTLIVTVITLAFVGVLLLLAFASFAVSFGVQAMQGPLAYFGVDEVARLVLQLISPALGAVPAFVFFYLTYRAVPRVAVGPHAARVGALVATGLWEVAKLLFGVYTRALSAFAAYGSLAFLAGLLTWIYLTALIILIGAEVVKYVRESTRTHGTAPVTGLEIKKP